MDGQTDGQIDGRGATLNAVSWGRRHNKWQIINGNLMLAVAAYRSVSLALV